MSGIEKTTLTAAVVGAGLMGRWHSAAIHRAGGKVTAIVDPDRERAAVLAARFVNAKVYTCLEDALRQVRPSVVHLCTPTSSHRLQAEQALKAGAHLLVEKPLAATFEETQEVFNLAEKNRLAVCPVHQFVFQDGMKRLQAWLPELGEVFQVTLVIHSAGGTTLDPARLDSLAADILPHPLSLLQALLPGSLESQMKVSRPGLGELRVTGIHIGSGAMGVGLAIEISLNARPPQNSLIVAAKNATLYADLFHGYAVRLPGSVSRAHKILQPFESSLRQFGAATGNLLVRILKNEQAYPGLLHLMSLFYQALRTGGRLPIPVQDALAVARARQSIMES